MISKHRIKHRSTLDVTSFTWVKAITNGLTQSQKNNIYKLVGDKQCTCTRL